MALDRYTTGGRSGSVSDTRQRLYDLMEAHTKGQAGLVREEEDRVRRAEELQARNFGSDAARGAQLGALAGPKGAAVGAAAGALKGMIRAVKDRKKSGQGTGEALWRTAFDLEGWIPDPQAAAGAASGVGGALMREEMRGGDSMDAMAALQSRSPGASSVRDNPSYDPELGTFEGGDYASQLEMDEEFMPVDDGMAGLDYLDDETKMALKFRGLGG